METAVRGSHPVLGEGRLLSRQDRAAVLEDLATGRQAVRGELAGQLRRAGAELVIERRRDSRYAQLPLDVVQLYAGINGVVPSVRELDLPPEQERSLLDQLGQVLGELTVSRVMPGASRGSRALAEAELNARWREFVADPGRHSATETALDMREALARHLALHDRGTAVTTTPQVRGNGLAGPGDLAADSAGLGLREILPIRGPWDQAPVTQLLAASESAEPAPADGGSGRGGFAHEPVTQVGEFAPDEIIRAPWYRRVGGTLRHAGSLWRAEGRPAQAVPAQAVPAQAVPAEGRLVDESMPSADLAALEQATAAASASAQVYRRLVSLGRERTQADVVGAPFGEFVADPAREIVDGTSLRGLSSEVGYALEGMALAIQRLAAERAMSGNEPELLTGLRAMDLGSGVTFDPLTRTEPGRSAAGQIDKFAEALALPLSEAIEGRTAPATGPGESERPGDQAGPSATSLRALVVELGSTLGETSAANGSAGGRAEATESAAPSTSLNSDSWLARVGRPGTARQGRTSPSDGMNLESPSSRRAGDSGETSMPGGAMPADVVADQGSGLRNVPTTSSEIEVVRETLSVSGRDAKRTAPVPGDTSPAPLSSTWLVRSAGTGSRSAEPEGSPDPEGSSRSEGPQQPEGTRRGRLPLAWGVIKGTAIPPDEDWLRRRRQKALASMTATRVAGKVPLSISGTGQAVAACRRPSEPPDRT